MSTAEKQIFVTVSKDGPYIVSGDARLAEQVIVANANGESLQWHEGEPCAANDAKPPVAYRPTALLFDGLRKFGVQKLKALDRFSDGAPASSCVYVYAALSACAFCSAYACGETEFFLSVRQHSVRLPPNWQLRSLQRQLLVF
jgi:hypothetical protein